MATVICNMDAAVMASDETVCEEEMTWNKCCRCLAFWNHTAPILCCVFTQEHNCADAVVLYDPDWSAALRSFVRSKLHRAFEAVVFARHPLVSLRHQHLALLSISLVQATSQLMDAQHP